MSRARPFPILRPFLRPCGGALLAIAAAALAPAARAGSVPTPECRRDLLVAESRLRTARESLLTLENAPPAQRCAVWRDHVRTARAVGAVFQRCLTDTDQRTRTAEMASSVNDFQQAIASSCKGK